MVGGGGTVGTRALLSAQFIFIFKQFSPKKLPNNKIVGFTTSGVDTLRLGNPGSVTVNNCALVPNKGLRPSALKKKWRK